MKLTTRTGQPALLTYCANAHPGERLDDVYDAIARFAGPIRRELELDEMALGLWLSASALRELGGERGAGQLSSALSREGLYAFTFNGFPFGDFHADVVKHAVYQPDWTTEPRYGYTLALARLLAEILPPWQHTGTISTLPLAHRSKADSTTERLALRNLCRLAEELARLRDRTGNSIRVCIEPEPGCLLETTTDAVRLFAEALPETAGRAGYSRDAVYHQLALCYDACHQAVAFEDAAASLAELRRAIVPVGKVQLSAAIELAEPGSPAARAALASFDEPRFLHQVRVRRRDGSIAGVDDLPAAAGQLPSDQPWRVHFHVPIHREVAPPVTTTRPFLDEFARALVDTPGPGGDLPQLEVETYTWTVLPEGERPRSDADLVRGIADELRYARGLLA